MEINKLKSIIHSNCKLKIKDDIQNTYSYDKWPEDKLRHNYEKKDWIDDHKYTLSYDNGRNIVNSLAEPDKYFTEHLIVLTDKIKYKYSKPQFNMLDQISMIKLFMAVILTRKVVKYKVLENKAVRFTFYLFNKSTSHYDKEVLLTVDNRVIIDDNSEVVVTDSESLLDHLLLKAFIKLSNIMKINPKSCNVNSLVGICKGGKLFKLSINKDVDVNSLIYTVDSLLNDEEDTLDDKMKQCTWLHDNIFRSAYGQSLHAYNEYSLSIQRLYEADALIGMTMGDSFIYIINNVIVEQNGGMYVIFSNIFGGKKIRISIETIMNCVNQIGVIITKGSS